jgi:hypothetical protein
MNRIITYTLITFFSILLMVGCADFFAPGLREATEQLETDVANVASEQGGLTRLISEGQELLQSKLDEAKASIETINFRSEEDRAGAEALLASLETKLGDFSTAAGERASALDGRIGELFADTQAARDALAAADTPGAAISVLGKMLVPFLGPYAPVGEIALALLGLGGTARVSSRRAKTSAATGILAPIEKARMKHLEEKLAIDDPTRKFIVFDSAVTKPVFDANGAKAIIDSFS